MNFSNSVDWWASTNSSPGVFRPSHLTVEMEVALRMMAGIDSALIAVDLGISRQHVEAHQRKLGLRALATTKTKYATDHRGHRADR